MMGKGRIYSLLGALISSFICLSNYAICSADFIRPEIEGENIYLQERGAEIVPEVESFSAYAKCAYLDRASLMLMAQGIQKGAVTMKSDARRYLSEAVKIDPTSSFLHVKVAENALAMNDVGTAEDELKTAIMLNEKNADAYYLLGRIRYLEGKSKKDEENIRSAIEYFKRAVQCNPGHVNAQNYLGTISYDMGDYSQAVEAFRELVKVRPYDAEIRYKLGTAYAEIGELDKAIEGLRAAVMIDEDHVQARTQLASLYARKGRYLDAVQEAEKVLRLAPGFNDIKVLLAHVLSLLGRYDEAINYCNEVLRSQDYSKREILAEAYLRRGMAFKGKKAEEMADRDLRRAIEIYELIYGMEPEKLEINYYLAMAYDGMGDHVTAEKKLLEYISKRPDASDAYNYLGYMLVQNNGDLERAVGYIKKALELEPNNGAYLDSLGWAYVKLGRIDEGIELLERAKSEMPLDSEIHEHLGEAYLIKGLKENAVAEWEMSVNINPSKQELKEKINKLRATK